LVGGGQCSSGSVSQALTRVEPPSAAGPAADARYGRKRPAQFRPGVVTRPLQVMDFFSSGHMLADVAAIIGSLEIVFGEIDR